MLAFYYTFLILVSSFFSPEPKASLARVFPHILGFIIFLFILSLNSLDREERTRFYDKMTANLVTSGTVMALYYIINLCLVAYSYGLKDVLLERYPGGLISLPWGATNVIAAALIMPIFTAIGKIDIVDSTSRKLTIIEVGIMVLAIFLTLSRNSIIVILVTFFILAMFKRDLKYFITLIIFFIAVACLFFIYDEQTSTIIYELRSEGSDVSNLNGRIELLETYFMYFIDNPLTPIGYYGSQYIFQLSSHNLILSTLVEQGLHSLLNLITLFGALFWRCVKRMRSGNLAVSNLGCVYCCGLLAVFFNLQFEDANFTQQYIIYFWIFLGIMCLSRW